MPLWQIFHPADAYTPEDRKTLSERITALHASGNVPKFYVVIAFHPLPADSMYVGGEPRSNFVRFKIDQVARTLPGEVLRAWWMRRIEEVIAPFVTQRGLESEVQIDEPPADLWTINGIAPPPFGSIAEIKWFKENKVVPYSEDEKMPPTPKLADGMRFANHHLDPAMVARLFEEE
jgi:phenylpyruvate tautomerase PptA (4-oxalocrotonate tautomerase family)